MDEKEKQRMLAVTLGQIEKQFGKGTVQRLGAHEASVQVSVVSSGSVSLDAALGVGGFPRGRTVDRWSSVGISCCGRFHAAAAG